MNMALVHSCLLSPYLFIAFCGAGLGGNPDNGWSTNGFAVCMGIVLSSGSRLHFFFLVGERGNASCTIAPEAPCVGLNRACHWVYALWIVCPASYPLKTPAVSIFKFYGIGVHHCIQGELRGPMDDMSIGGVW